jgi:hypothetical protein
MGVRGMTWITGSTQQEHLTSRHLSGAGPATTTAARVAISVLQHKATSARDN